MPGAPSRSLHSSSVGEHVKIHIVTAGYLRRFTDVRGHLQTVRRADPPTRRIAPRRPETVGYRSRYFTEPEIAMAAERRLSRYESAGLKSLRKIDTTWPLEADELFQDRLHIACLVAIHMLRNEAFKQHTARLQARSLAQRLPEYEMGEAREEILLRELTSERFRVDHMLGMIPKMASMIASAHWSVIEFPAPLLATGDQPVTVVPLLEDGVSATVQPHPDHGFLLTEEMRFPIDPRRALLFTWANELDAPEPLRAGDDIAADLNRAVIAQADREWFHNPDRRPTRLPTSGLQTEACASVGRELLAGYDAAAAMASRRRHDAVECLDQMIEGEVVDRFHVARISVAA